MSKELENIANSFSSFEDSLTAVKEFLRNTPLYVKLKIPLPNTFSKIYPDSLLLDCLSCKAERPFKDARPGGGSGAPPYSGGMVLPPAKPQSSTRYFAYTCTFCKALFECWVYLDYEKQQIHKVGQHPMWLPKIAKDIEGELGEDAELYQKALRNMNEGYGIGACAYLRRLIEK